jgi:hypothetical protein
MDCLHQVSAIIILDNEGRRVFAKFYPNVATGGLGKWASVEGQLNFEKSLHAKTRAALSAASEGESVLIYEGMTVLYQLDPELTYYVAGPGDENELVLAAVLRCVYESLQQLCKTVQSIDKRTLLEMYEALLLVVDETVDDGIIFETNSANVIAEIEKYVVVENQATDNAKKALQSFNRFLKQTV